MSKKLFIIEDDPTILYGLQDGFTTDDYEVTSSSGDDEELDALIEDIKKAEPDFLILDLILPKLDGFEIIKKIRDTDELADLRIFIFTDLSDEDSKARSLELGVSYYFVKSEFDAFQFAEKVKSIIEDRDLPQNDEEDLVME